MNLLVKNLKNKDAGDVSLSSEIFGQPLRLDILARVVRWQLAGRRSGTHKTCGISEISGTTRKPYRQKGTGRARQGSLRSPQFRGGATIFGPVVRDHSFSLPKKVRKLALRIALSSKLAENALLILDNFSLPSAKTRDVALAMKDLGLRSALLISGDSCGDLFVRSVANIPGIDLLPQVGINVYDILRHSHLVLEKQVVTYLEARLK